MSVAHCHKTENRPRFSWQRPSFTATLRHFVAADREAHIGSWEETETHSDQIKPLQVGSVPRRVGQIARALVLCSARVDMAVNYEFKHDSWTSSLLCGPVTAANWITSSHFFLSYSPVCHCVSIKELYWDNELLLVFLFPDYQNKSTHPDVFGLDLVIMGVMKEPGAAGFQHGREAEHVMLNTVERIRYRHVALGWTITAARKQMEAERLSTVREVGNVHLHPKPQSTVFLPHPKFNIPHFAPKSTICGRINCCLMLFGAAPYVSAWLLLLCIF